MHTEAEPFKVYTERHFDKISQINKLEAEQQLAMKVVANVLPFRVNQYVIDNLIDWDNVPNDPIFQLTFPQPGMLSGEDFDLMQKTLQSGCDHQHIKQVAHGIRGKLNPHPAGQKTLNVPHMDGHELQGMQHKYRETLLFFPSQGQTCHSYCSFCFRWAQFIGDKELRISSSETHNLHEYLKKHSEISDLLVTGGDPMVMKTSHLKAYLLPLLDKEFDHIQNIRIGTKAVSFWPQRFITDKDADDLIDLLKHIVDAGKHVAIMMHINHWRELDTSIAQEAVRRLRKTGAILRSQSPLLRHINDDPDIWAKMWRMQTGMGIIPYYMFIERDTGAKAYFEVPLFKAWEIYKNALKQVSGLSRTARGPSMSATPGKVEIQGITEIAGEKVFACRFIQSRNPDWVQHQFFAKYDEKATWLNHLEPAFDEENFFFEQ